MTRPIVSVDFDGTLVRNRWPEKTREWMPGAVEAMHALLDSGCHVFVFTARISPGRFGHIYRDAAGVQEEINYIRDLLDSAGLTGIDIWTQPGKPYADVYVDDKAVHYAGRSTSWSNVLDKLLTMFGKEDIEIAHL